MSMIAQRCSVMFNEFQLKWDIKEKKMFNIGLVLMAIVYVMIMNSFYHKNCNKILIKRIIEKCLSLSVSKIRKSITSQKFP